MELNGETWFAVTLEASKRVLEPHKSKEFLTPFDMNMPHTPENLALVIEQIQASIWHGKAAHIVCEFIQKLIPEAHKVIKEMERRQNGQGQ